MSILTKTVGGLDFLSKKTVILHPTGSHRSEMKKEKNLHILGNSNW